LLKDKTYDTFCGKGNLKSLPGLCLELLSEQKKAWQDLREGYESLKDVRERDVPCRGFSVRLQYNPGRIKSSLAGVAEKNVEPHGQSPSHPTLRPNGVTGRPHDGAFLHGQRPWSPAAGMIQVDGVLLYRMRDLGREVIILEGDDPMAVGNAFKGYLNALKKVLLLNEEPMMNIAGFYNERKWEERRWRLVIFPRRKHRPDDFFREGDARVVVSPGVIDMGGLLVTPVEKDFERLDGAAVESIYGEVSLEGKTVEKAIDAMVYLPVA
jgi:hypothetical protein